MPTNTDHLYLHQTTALIFGLGAITLPMFPPLGLLFIFLSVLHHRRRRARIAANQAVLVEKVREKQFQAMLKTARSLNR